MTKKLGYARSTVRGLMYVSYRTGLLKSPGHIKGDKVIVNKSKEGMQDKIRAAFGLGGIK